MREKARYFFIYYFNESRGAMMNSEDLLKDKAILVVDDEPDILVAVIDVLHVKDRLRKG